MKINSHGDIVSISSINDRDCAKLAILRDKLGRLHLPYRMRYSGGVITIGLKLDYLIKLAIEEV